VRHLAAPAAILLLTGVGGGAVPPRGDPVAGERLFRQCAGCHALEPGRDTAAAPTLHRIVGRRIAAEPRFNYSPALRRLAVQQPRWTYALLDRYLAAPDAVAPGTEMDFIGMRDPGQRRALIAWLRRR
jgi:cytochrome c